MGTFCTSSSIYTKVVGITNNTANTSIIDQCISQSEDHIKCSISRRYDVSAFNTTTSIPPLLTTLCELYTEGLFWEANSRGGKESITRADKIFKRVDAKLLMLSSGKTDLLNTSGSQITELPNNNFALTSTTNYTPTFGEDDSLSWEVDSNKLDDLESDRG